MHKPQSVLHIIDHGGASPYLETLARRTDRDAFALHVGSLGPAGALQGSVDGVATPFALDARSRRDYPAAIARLVNYVRVHRIAMIQTHLFESSLVGVIAARVMRVASVVTTHHSMEMSLMTGTRAFWAERLNLRFGTRYISAPAPRVKDRIVELHHAAPQKIAVVPYWFELERWRSKARTRAVMREALGVGEAFVFLAVGRLHWVKNYPLMLAAFARAFGKRRDVILLIAGDGPDREVLQNQAGERVRFLGSRSDVPALMAAADSFLHASHVECFSQVAVEAAAAGLPLVSTAVGGVIELVNAEHCGFVATPGDVDGLAACMQTMVALDAAEKVAISERAVRAAAPYAAEPRVRQQEEQTIKWINDNNAI